ncbi:MAG: radical SAM protein [Candidatus Jordarchaeales archaeon]
MLKRFTGKCEKDGARRLKVALELFAGIRRRACYMCSHVVRPLVEWAIVKGGEAFGVSEDELKRRFSDAYWCTGLTNVVLGIAKFGVRKPFVPGAPFLVVWDYTYACNLRCKHCYASAGVPLEDEMSLDEKLKAAESLADAGVTAVAFSGGEPLVRKDVFRVMGELKEHGVFVAIATNGTLITREMARRIKEAGVGFVQISLDGSVAEVHDDFRGITGAYERTIQGIRNCVEEGLFVEVSTTATKTNYGEIGKIADLCEELGVKWYMIFNCVPSGRGRFIIENDLTPEEREELLTYLWRRMHSRKKVEYLSTAPQFARVALQQEGEAGVMKIPGHFYNPELYGQLKSLGGFIGGCGAGRMYAALKPNGALQPCVFMPLTIGNLRDDSFEELWDIHPVFETLRDRSKLKENCRSCPYRDYCGGCRARAYSYFGEITAPDPGCIRNKEFFEVIKRS